MGGETTLYNTECKGLREDPGCLKLQVMEGQPLELSFHFNMLSLSAGGCCSGKKEPWLT